jgi:hypothetical protein
MPAEHARGFDTPWDGLGKSFGNFSPFELALCVVD